MKNLFLLSLCLFIMSCSENFIGQDAVESHNLNLLDEPSDSGLCISDEEFMAIAEGFVDYLVEFRDTKRLSLQEKLRRLEEATNNLGTIGLCELAEIHSENLLIERKNVDDFFSTLIEYREIITAPGFSECFYQELKNRVGKDAFDQEESTHQRWFLATLASALGAGPCVTGPLAVLDTCAYVATGILTSPTGFGAVACWGGATTSFGYALSTIGDC